MEFLLTSLPTIFCYLTGALIAWSGMILLTYLNIFRHAKKMGRRFRRADLIQAGTIGVVGIGLTVALFVIPNQTAKVMDLLLVLDCWYLVYLISAGNISARSQLAIRSVNVAPPSLTIVSGRSASKSKLI